MRIGKRFSSVVLATMMAVEAVAGVYMVPRDYDNMRISQWSHTVVTIKNDGTAVPSDRDYAVGGTSSKILCKPVPKIECRGGSVPKGYASLVRTALTDDDTGGYITPADYVIAVEEDDRNFYVCGAAYGYIVYDDSYLVNKGTTTENGQDFFQFEYVYIPLAISRDYYWFVTSIPTGTDPNTAPVLMTNADSRMDISFRQICDQP